MKDYRIHRHVKRSSRDSTVSKARSRKLGRACIF